MPFGYVSPYRVGVVHDGEVHLDNVVAKVREIDEKIRVEVVVSRLFHVCLDVAVFGGKSLKNEIPI